MTRFAIALSFASCTILGVMAGVLIDRTQKRLAAEEERIEAGLIQVYSSTTTKGVM